LNYEIQIKNAQPKWSAANCISISDQRDVSRAILKAFAVDFSGVPKRKEKAKAHNGNEP
jgi:hypothetical protein